MIEQSLSILTCFVPPFPASFPHPIAILAHSLIIPRLFRTAVDPPHWPGAKTSAWGQQQWLRS